MPTQLHTEMHVPGFGRLQRTAMVTSGSNGQAGELHFRFTPDCTNPDEARRLVLSVAGGFRRFRSASFGPSGFLVCMSRRGDTQVVPAGQLNVLTRDFLMALQSHAEAWVNAQKEAAAST